MSRHTQRTLAALKKQGYTVGMVERFIPIPGGHGKRHDLFGFIDIIAIKEGEILGVQSCGSGFSEHDKKILSEPKAVEWLKAGGKLELWAWRKIKQKRGGSRYIYQPRIKQYTLEDFDALLLLPNNT